MSIKRENVFDRDRRPIEYGRLLTLTDGVFAIAVTLLALSLEVPSGLERGELGSALVDASPVLISFTVSLIVIALFWFSHHELFSEVQRFDARLVWMNFVFLGLVVLIPVVQSVQGSYPGEPISYVIFSTILTLGNFIDLLMRRYVYKADLLEKSWPPARYRTEMYRGIALTVGFALSIFLSFVLVSLTIIVWMGVIPVVESLVSRYPARSNERL